ncbi:MAG TPA: hypothetical protein VL985_03320, partial [Stellaceae bacterium]|nr:hypothetical protein [Stellaceae bacterium]
MRRWALIAAASALVGAALWHLPATAQRTTAVPNSQPVIARPAAGTAVDPPPRQVAPQLITFEEYREFRLRDIAERQERLARALAAPGLSAAEKADLDARKAYYDRLAALPDSERDRLFRARFDRIDTNHDGMIDDAERTAWREKQRLRYRELASQPVSAEAD